MILPINIAFGARFLLFETLGASAAAAAAAATQARCTDTSQNEYRPDGWTPKPTSDRSLVVQRQETSDQVCGVLQGNSGMLCGPLSRVRAPPSDLE